MSQGERRNAELSRAALLVMAGGALVAISQRAPELASGPAGKAVLVVGAVIVLAGLVFAVRSLFRRSGGADR